MKKCTVLIIFALFSSTVCFAQNGKISGTLTFEDGSPVTYATVVIQSFKKHALSDDKGRYEITGIPYGTYQIEINSIEIQPAAYTIHINSSAVNQSFKLKNA